ncbi:glycosyltransferase [Patescibacteria group bacterium]|nr:glycosyltransferase [Patescibacteria group bacterium]
MQIPDIDQKIIKILDLYKKKEGSFKTLKKIKQLKHVLSKKKIKIAIYDHAFHFAGGGQKYAAMIASRLQNKCDITFYAHKKIDFKTIKNWYDIDLSKCKLKIIPIKEYENAPYVYPILKKDKKTFIDIEKESANYDIFINANMHPYIKPLSAISIFICHFPDQERNRDFKIDNYDYFIVNSNFGKKWLKNKWSISQSTRIYPGVNMRTKKKSKNNIILSVSRFEEGGSKQQHKMIEAFSDLHKKNHEIFKNWKLVLAGGSCDPNPYLEKLKNEAKKTDAPIEIKTNISQQEIKELYQKAKIFWHLCGLNENRPHQMEHFGMTTAEAMQNFCVPISVNCGGQKEIIKNNVNGFLINSIKELQNKTTIISKNKNKYDFIIDNIKKSNYFSYDQFYKNIDNFFEKIFKTHFFT